MKRAIMLTGCGALLVLAGCASNPNRGAAYGDADTYGTGYGYGAGNDWPAPAVQASPPLAPATAPDRPRQGMPWMRYDFGGGNIH